MQLEFECRSATMGIPFGYVKIAIENGDLQLIYFLKMVIFHNYAGLAEDVWWLENYDDMNLQQ